MVYLCIICNRKADVNTKLFRIPPSHSSLQEKWLSFLKSNSNSVDIEKLEYYRICNLHFVNGVRNYDETDPNSSPTIVDYNCKAEVARASNVCDRLRRVKLRSTNIVTEESTINYEEDISSDPVNLLSARCPSCQCFQAKVESLQKELEELKAQATPINQLGSVGDKTGAGNNEDDDANELNDNEDETENDADTNTGNESETDSETDSEYGTDFWSNFTWTPILQTDKWTQYLTGLPNFKTFQWICMKFGHNSGGSLCIEDQVFAFLMRLRLAMPFKLQALLFNSCISTMARNFYKWLRILFYGLKSLVSMPDLKDIVAANPPSFNNYSNLVAILDCTEIYIETPSSREARAKTYSHYKKHNTIKFLIACTPSGSICFVSKVWGGRVSDQYLVRESNFLSQIKAGFSIMADRGFLIEDDCAIRNIDLYVPPYTRGQSQMSGEAVKDTRCIAKLRIKVEHVLGSIKNTFEILKYSIPITMLRPKTEDGISEVDMIVTVCAALVNIRF